MCFCHKTKQQKSRNTSLLVDVYTSELGALYTGDPSWFAWHSSTLPTRKRERVVSGFGTLELNLHFYLKTEIKSQMEQCGEAEALFVL